jgi:flagellar basal-body rod protein FlgF
MDRLIYTSLTAMRGAQARQTATAHNLANANTPGFRADVAGARSLWLSGAALQTRTMSGEEVISADMRPGTRAQTGRALDVALDGDALLSVQAENGDESYTRRGDLQVNGSGLLTTGDGRPVLGPQGPITLPPADSVSIDKEGRVFVVPQGGDPNQPQEVDRLKIVSPAGSEIVKGLDGLFRVRDGGTLPADPDGRVVTGFIEGSNVEATAALVEMIEASRSWDANLKLLADARELDASAAQLMQLPQ